MRAAHWQEGSPQLCFCRMPRTPPPPSPDWCLFLDVDGTLVELTDTPSQTSADVQIKTLLRNVAERLGGAVALISGRKIQTLDELFAPLRLPAAGLHGIERRAASGAMQGASFIDAQLNGARVEIRSLVAAHPGTLMEDKDRTIAVHFRLAPQFAEVMRRSIIDIAKPLGSHYHIQSGKMIYEIKPQGFSKATAIEAFMQEPPFVGRRPVFVGDDLTDLDGFAIVEALGGISIAVGDQLPARYRLRGVGEVRDWLQTLAALQDRPRA